MLRKFDTGKLKEKNVIATILVILLTAIILIISNIKITQLTKNRCLERIQEVANTVMDNVISKMANDSRILNAVAEIITVDDDFDTATMQKIMEEFSALTSSHNMNLLLPGDKVITSKTIIDGRGKISFEDEAALGEHVTNRMISLMDDNQMIIRHFVPIIQNGKTVAMLYSSTNLKKLPDALNIKNMYNGSASVYIIDRENGDFIMDTWHKELGNLNNMGVRETRGSITFGDVIKDVTEGRSGHVQFRSETTGEFMYFYYMPIKYDNWNIGDSADINKWTVAVTVPESEAFSNLHNIRKVCYALCMAEAILLILYLVWTMKNTKETLEKAVLEERLIKAENAERAKTMFLSSMSHDIRTPMNAIIGYTTLAATNIEDKEKIKDYLTKILSSSNHLLSLINDILDMSRIESGRVYIEETECSLPDILRDLRNILQSQMKSKNLDFYMDTIDVLDEDVYCDKLHLNQVLLNLLSNAIKFTPSGGSVSLTIKQKHGAPAGYGLYEIRVKDTGIGMSPEFVKKVFEPFERENTTTVSGIQGTGLGMAIAKNIVDMMGGKIEVESEPDKGTEFILTIELRLQNEPKQVEIIKELSGMHALVVDDDYNICDSVTKMLVQLGLRAHWTMSGKEAVLHAKQSIELGDEFDAYIIDWQMPDLSGIEVVRQIRKEIGDKVPIIILTAYDWSNIEEEAKNAGVTAFCNKPIFVSTLRDTLLSAIGDFNQQADEEDTIPTVSDDIKGKRILLVEDNELNSEIAEAILTESGFIIETANDGTVAVDKVRSSEPGYYDLILMDVQMPEMNGYEATKAIRSLDNKALASIPIIAMTANAFNEDREEALRNGMNDHVAKPLNMEKLFDVLNKYLR